MKGLELSEKFYREYGAPMLHEHFAEFEGVIAVGLAGSGSECFGYDDVTSQDHDFEPGFCLFIPDTMGRDTEFALERAYAKLPREYMGYKRSPLSPVGGNRHGVKRISDFFAEKTGTADGELSLTEWFFTPEQSLAEATNGKVFRDDSGSFTGIRKKLSYLPQDVRIKKLAGQLLLMGQAGQYNYPRLLKRGETAAAQLAVVEFVKSALHAVFLLNQRYLPYYKWSFHALAELPLLSALYAPLERLLASGNTSTEAEEKKRLIEDICSAIASELSRQQLSKFKGTELEGHAYDVNDRIKDASVRNLHILYAV